jgi:hypothetical protein
MALTLLALAKKHSFGIEAILGVPVDPDVKTSSDAGGRGET